MMDVLLLPLVPIIYIGVFVAVNLVPGWRSWAIVAAAVAAETALALQLYATARGLEMILLGIGLLVAMIAGIAGLATRALTLSLPNLSRGGRIGIVAGAMLLVAAAAVAYWLYVTATSVVQPVRA